MGSDATEIVDPVGASIVAVTASVAQHVFPVDPQIEMQRVRLARPKVEARIAQDRGRRSALQDRVAALIEQPASRSGGGPRSGSEEHTSELQSLMRISYAVFCLKKKTAIN